MAGEVFQLTVCFNGRVQGVFFRATTEQIARQFAVTGRVKNLPDGRVWLLAEGDQSEVEAFLHQIQEARSQHITDVEREESHGTRQFEDFGIAY